MDTYTISATELKKRVSEVLNTVRYEKREAVVERHGKPIARIVPVLKADKKKDVSALLKKYYGIMPDFPDVTTMRHFRKRNIKL